MKIHTSITRKVTFVFVMYTAALLLILVLTIYPVARSVLQGAVSSELEASAFEKQKAISDWVKERQDDVEILANEPAFVSDLGSMPASPNGGGQESSYNKRLVADMTYLAAPGHHFLSLFVLDPKRGQVIASTQSSEKGKLKGDQPYYLDGRSSPFVHNAYMTKGEKVPTIIVSTPVRGPGGSLLGVLAGRLNIDDVRTMMARRTAFRRTDDAYLLYGANLFLTRPRFASGPTVVFRGNSRAAAAGLAHENGVMLDTDYRDVPVLAAYRWLPERELCLIVQMDQAEAFGPIHRLGFQLLLFGVIALLIASVVAAWLARGITRPVRRLQEGVLRFGQGDLSFRLPEKSSDELGILAREFNSMANALAEEHTLLRHRAEQFFNLSTDMLGTIDFEGRFRDLNPAWERNLGYTSEELRSRPFEDFVHPDDRDATRDETSRLEAGAPTVNFENRCRHKDNSYRWFSWTAAASADDQLIYAAARDITQSKLAQMKLSDQAAELERSNKELEQFAYVASHDLQEPLRSVASYVQLLARRYKGKLDKDADDFINFAVEGSERMKTLINDLLSYSRVATQGKEQKRVDLESVLDIVLKNLQLVVENTGARISHQSFPAVLADDVQMVQLFQNLINNAIKFHGKEAPMVQIAAKREGGRWLISVRDNGIGIDPQHNDRIFVIFQRLHSRGEYPGTGIGLAVCRRIVERHGGRIWVESEPGHGSTFLFTLPALEEQSSSSALKPSPSEETKKQDDAFVRRASELI